MLRGARFIVNVCQSAFDTRVLYGVADELSLGVGLGVTVTFGVGVGLMPPSERPFGTGDQLPVGTGGSGARRVMLADGLGRDDSLAAGTTGTAGTVLGDPVGEAATGTPGDDDAGVPRYARNQIRNAPQIRSTNVLATTRRPRRRGFRETDVSGTTGAAGAGGVCCPEP